MRQSLKRQIEAQEPALYQVIWHHAVDELCLPYLVDFSIIGFGKFTNFYMFFISCRDGKLYINIRRRFSRVAGENMMRIPFLSEHEEQILSAIDAIYANYQAGEAAWGCEDLVVSKTSDISFLGLEMERLDAALEVLKAHIEQTGDREIIRPRVGTRAYNVLRENGIITDSQLVAFGATRLAGCKNCGRKTLEKLTEFVLRRTSFEQSDDGIPLHLQHAEIWHNIEDKIRLALQNDTGATTQVGDETIGLYQEMGKRFGVTADALLDHLVSASSHAKRSLAILRDYTKSDTVTLADVAASWQISREGVRQQVNKGKKRCHALFAHSLKARSRIFHQHLATLVEIFETVGCDNLVPFAAYGLTGISYRKLEMTFSILFYAAIGERIAKDTKAYVQAHARQTDALASQAYTPFSWHYFASKIFFPASGVSLCPSSVEQYEAYIEYDYEEQLEKTLTSFSPFPRVIKHPNLPFGEYRPDFLLVLPDGQGVLVMVAPTLSLALYYNVCKMNALHAFSKEEGYGYLILDDQNRSVFDLRRLPVPASTREALLTVLEERGAILEEDIEALRNSHTLTNETLAAFVLSEKLHFAIDPFCIKRRDR